MNRLYAKIQFFATCLTMLCMFGCGLDQMFEEIKPGYFLNTAQDGAEIIKPVVLLGIEVYEANFGACPRKVDIVMRSMPFYVGGQLAGGCSYGGLIHVGVDPYSECETIRALLHELSHACRYLQDDYEFYEPNWTWELNDITYQLFLDGQCLVNEEGGLYNPYVWN